MNHADLREQLLRAVIALHSRRGPPSRRELAKHLGVTHAAVNRRLRTAHERMLIEWDASSARSLRLTAIGHNWLYARSLANIARAQKAPAQV